MALYTAPQLAARYGVSERTGRRWIADALAGKPGSYPAQYVEVVSNNGKRELAGALDVPDGAMAA